MSIVDERGLRATVCPPPIQRSPQDERYRSRDRSWLLLKRDRGCSVRDLAASLGIPHTTVFRAIKQAQSDEDAEIERQDEAAHRQINPLLDSVSGLSRDDAEYLQETYSDSDLASDPDISAFLARCGYPLRSTKGSTRRPSLVQAGV